MSEMNLIAVTFDEPSKAYEAFSLLKAAGAEGRLDVRSAAVVRRDGSGTLSVPEAVGGTGGDGALGGGMVGMLVGVLAGPVGMLLGWGTGALIGGLADVDRTEKADALLRRFADAVPAGGTAVVAEVEEGGSGVLDDAMAGLGGVVFRRPALEVLVELEAAEDARELARAEAHRAMRAEKRESRKDDFESRKAELKAKLSRSRKDDARDWTPAHGRR